MKTLWVLVGIVGIAAAAILGWIYLRQRRELRRLARAVRACDSRTSGRVAVGLRSSEVLELADAVNDLLETEHQARKEELAARQTFQDDLAALAHDVRTPLAGAQGYLELAELDPDPAAQKRWQAAARERLGVVRDLVEDLFAYAHLAAAAEDGEVQDAGVDPVPVLAAVEDALAAQYPAFAERGWRPCVDFADEGLCVRASQEDLARVFANLTVNALRHGASAPSVVQRGHRVVFSNSVRDPAAIEVDRLFERFYRGDAPGVGGGGGLGLAIVKRLCNKMGAGVSASLEDSVLAIELRLPDDGR